MNKKARRGAPLCLFIHLLTKSDCNDIILLNEFLNTYPYIGVILWIYLEKNYL